MHNTSIMKIKNYATNFWIRWLDNRIRCTDNTQEHARVFLSPKECLFISVLVCLSVCCFLSHCSGENSIKYEKCRSYS